MFTLKVGYAIFGGYVSQSRVPTQTCSQSAVMGVRGVSTDVE